MGDATVLAIRAAPDAIELRHLRAFAAVAEELNFSRAAARLYISQPALSRQISALERLVGCPLLRRSTHGVELTLAGEALLSRAGRLISDLDHAVATTRSVGGELAEQLTRLWAAFIDVNAMDGNIRGVRAAVEELHAKFPPPSEVQIAPTITGGVPALLTTPPAAAGAPMLLLHGGGHIAGSAYGYRHLAGALAMVSGRPVLTPDFRLAPEHPFPAALDDAIRVYLALLDDNKVSADDLVVAGDSSGGGLAMSVLLALRERGHRLPGRALLMCPWLDLTGATQEHQAADAPPIVTPDQIVWLAGMYTADGPDDPLLSPLTADLTGLPPMLVQAGTGDNLVQDAKLLVQRAVEAGVDASLDLYPVPTHDFHLFWTFLPEAVDALQRAGEFLAADADQIHTDTG